MRFLLIYIALIFPAANASENKRGGFEYCVATRLYDGMGDTMGQVLVFKLNKENKNPKMYQYSYSYIYREVKGRKPELRESSYRPNPYIKDDKKREIYSVLNSDSSKNITQEGWDEIKFMREKVLVKDRKGKFVYPCPYSIRAMFDRSHAEGP